MGVGLPQFGCCCIHPHPECFGTHCVHRGTAAQYPPQIVVHRAFVGAWLGCVCLATLLLVDPVQDGPAAERWVKEMGVLALPPMRMEADGTVSPDEVVPSAESTASLLGRMPQAKPGSAPSEHRPQSTLDATAATGRKRLRGLPRKVHAYHVASTAPGGDVQSLSHQMASVEVPAPPDAALKESDDAQHCAAASGEAAAIPLGSGTGAEGAGEQAEPLPDDRPGQAAVLPSIYDYQSQTQCEGIDDDAAWRTGVTARVGVARGLNPSSEVRGVGLGSGYKPPLYR